MITRQLGSDKSVEIDSNVKEIVSRATDKSDGMRDSSFRCIKVEKKLSKRDTVDRESIVFEIFS